MYTVLGASVTTAPEDLNNDLLAQTGLIFAEGYIWDAEPGRAAFTQAARQVRASGQAAFRLPMPIALTATAPPFTGF